jgi:glutamate formiminotransferase
MIYEFALTKPERIVIVDSTEYLRAPYWELNYYDNQNWEEDKIDNEGLEAIRGGRKKLVAKNINLTTDLLQTCRQIYHEASGIL